MPEKYPIKIAGMCFTDKKYFCSKCNGDVKGFKDRPSAREFKVSGLCQECQDEIFGVEGNEEDQS